MKQFRTLATRPIGTPSAKLFSHKPVRGPMSAPLLRPSATKREETRSSVDLAEASPLVSCESALLYVALAGSAEVLSVQKLD
eukprot:465389-Pelagomonas_calceolata.AAC.2